MLRRIQHLLSEPVMGFLALAALVFGVSPDLYPVPPSGRTLLILAEWIVVALFAAEYAVNLLLADDKRAYVLNPWRLLDLFIILAPFITVIPGVPEQVRSAPALRVLRLIRAIVAGTRASARLRHETLAPKRRLPSGPPFVTQLSPDSEKAAELDWDDLIDWLKKPSRGWLHASHLESRRIEEIAGLTGTPRGAIDVALGEASYPRLEPGSKWTALAMVLPRDDGARESLLLLIADDAVLSLSLHKSELQSVARPLPDTAHTWPLRVVLGLVRLAILRHEDVAGRFERALRVLEDLPADETPSGFFEQVFRMRKRISASRADLWRLSGMLHGLAEGRRALPGLGKEARADIERIAEEAGFLHETAHALGDSLGELLDLHLNMSGYGLNRFMRLLAIVSALGLIPTIIGGLLGMNLVTNPWPATLTQVAFGTFILMLCVLYTFLAKGWLK
jgi:Mg2+ and Co2+ transporter CorA